jgi:protein-tyrosine phosphatase
MIIDFHSHILPEMDDGAENLETSLAMLRESKSQGVD